MSGGLLPEGVGASDEEVVLIESRKDELCVTTIESVEIGWSVLGDLGVPVEIPLVGPNPIPTDFDLGDFHTRTLEKMMRDLRTGNRPLWGLGRRDSTR